MSPTERKALETRAPGEKPPVEELVQQLFDSSGTDDGDWYGRIQDAHDTRFALWDGQSEDGRKHADSIGKPAFPWEGASDTRLRRVESIILELANTMLASFHRGSFQASGVDQDADPAAAALIAPLLKYLFRNKMRCEIRDELNFLINWLLTYGCSVMWIDWHQEMRMEEKEVTLRDMVEMALNNAAQEALAFAEEQELDEQETNALIQEATLGSFDKLKERIFSAEYEPVAIEMLLADAPHLDESNARAMLEELREFGATTFPNPYVHTNQPRWTALRPGFDIFWPYLTSNIQRARFVARAEILSRAELEAKENEEGWDPDFIEFMVKKGEGVIYEANMEIDSVDGRGFMDTSSNVYADRTEEYRDQYQVMHFYYRGKDKKGFPVIYRTITSPLCSSGDDGEKGLYALDEINQYDHGLIPAVEFRREYFHRPLMEARGVSEIARTAQAELKTHRDALIDQASITSNPPILGPRQRAGVNIQFGPGRHMHEHRTGSMRWMDPPKNDGRTELASELIENDLAEYFGLMRETVPEDKVMLFKQCLVEDFLTTMSAALKMTVAVYQQFGDPLVISRVTNAPPIEISPEEIRGQYDVVFEFDVRDLLLEQAKLKAEVFRAAGELDTEGRLDRGAMGVELLSGYSPTLAERVTKDAEQAAQDEMAAAKQDLAMMSAGVEPLKIEGGKNSRLRAQVVQQGIKENPEMNQRYNGGDEIFKALIDNYLQYLNQELEQEKNKQIGRVGAGSAFDQKVG